MAKRCKARAKDFGFDDLVERHENDAVWRARMDENGETPEILAELEWIVASDKWGEWLKKLPHS